MVICLFLTILQFLPYVAYASFFGRPGTSPLQEGELLPIAAVQLGATMLGKCWWLLCLLFTFCYLFCW